MFHQVKEGQKLSTWRAEDNERRLIDNTDVWWMRRHSNLLRSRISALVAGFSMVVRGVDDSREYTCGGTDHVCTFDSVVGVFEYCSDV